MISTLFEVNKFQIHFELYIYVAPAYFLYL
jgi:hypothetical protein